MPRRSLYGLVAMLAGLSLLSVMAAPPAAIAAGTPTGFSLSFEAAPTYYRYQERGRREFNGLETDWSAFAGMTMLEARYAAPFSLVGLLRFSGLSSTTSEETNNQSFSTTNMHIPYFIMVQPGVQYEFRPMPGLVIAPELAWDLDWYQQTREVGPFNADVDESVSWQGPAIGGEVSYAIGDWTAGLRYRHSFLLDVTASNSLFQQFGVGDFSTDGERDVLQLRGVHRISARWSLIVGYRFESARVNASDTQVVSRSIIQFPENEHTLQSFTVGASVAF